MKKSLLMLVCLMTVCTGYSQTASGNKDTCICITPGQMKNALKASDSLQVAKQIIIASDSLIGSLKQGIKSKEDLLTKSESSNVASRRIILNLDAQLEQKTKSNNLALDQVGLLHRQLKKQKWLTVKILGLSLSTIGALTYLLVK